MQVRDLRDSTARAQRGTASEWSTEDIMRQRSVWLLMTQCVCVAALGTACTLDSIVAQAGIPGTSAAASISGVATRGQYLDASVDVGGFAYRFFFPDSEECRKLLDEPTGVRFEWWGALGRVVGDVKPAGKPSP